MGSDGKPAQNSRAFLLHRNIDITLYAYRNTDKHVRVMDAPLQPSLVRLSISLPAELFAELDAMVVERGVANRSQMIAELIRNALAEHNARERPETVLAGTITLIYRAESGRVRQALAQVQAGYIAEIISSQHVFLEDGQSMEVLLVQDSALQLQKICDALRKVRGVQQVRLVTTTALLPPLSSKELAREARR
jgi:CopG family nickel-responsive transcriptional regulator